jgi:glucan biosynthesis protein C
MLLGVVYHTLLFRMFTEGFTPGTMGGSGPSRWIQDWLHSFRMPLSFLISGFFGRMMLEKYGTRDYLRRRWCLT